MANHTSTGSVVWKHIGLHGHSVGTFSCDTDRIVWKSAIAGRDDAGSGTHRSIPASLIAYAQWTVFGRNGHLRIGTTQDQQNSNRQPLKHELRFDGFPANDFDLFKQALADKYKVDLKTLNISAAGAQYGLTEIKGKNLIFRHCVLDEMNEEGQEFEPRAEDEMMSLDLHEVSQCVLPGNNRNEIEVQFPESDTVEAGTDQLGE
jgi:ribosomal protein S24E